MLESVIAFGFIISLFEFVIISMIPPRTRLRVLGCSRKKLLFHVSMLSINMIVHWGTAVGTMSATLAFVCSIGVTWAAAKVFGHLVDDRYYHVGWVKYSVEEIK